MRLVVELASLLRLLADVQQSDPRTLHVEHEPRVDAPHHRELVEVERLAIGGGADVQDDHVSLRRGKHRGDRRTLHRFDAAEAEQGRRDDGARVSGRNHGVRAALLLEPRGDVDRGVLLLPHRGGGGFTHLHAFRRVDHGRKRRVHVEARRLLAHERFVPDEHHFEGSRRLAHRLDGTLDHHARGEVAAHGIHADDRRSGSIAHRAPASAPTSSSAPPARSPLRPRSSRSDRTRGAEASAGCSAGRATGMASRVSSACGASCRGCSSVVSWVRPSIHIPFVEVLDPAPRIRSARLSPRPRRRNGMPRDSDPRRSAGRARRTTRGKAAAWATLAAPIL